MPDADQPVFPPVSRDQWRYKADKDLKGRPLESLDKTLHHGVTVRPLYDRGDLAGLATLDALPGEGSLTRGRPGRSGGWTSCQEYALPTPAELWRAIVDDRARGMGAARIHLDAGLAAGGRPEGRGAVLRGTGDIAALADGELAEFDLTVVAGAGARTLAELDLPARVEVLADPLSTLATQGRVRGDLFAGVASGRGRRQGVTAAHELMVYIDNIYTRTDSP